jgi:ABC-2 type transport system ATP-binding protein
MMLHVSNIEKSFDQRRVLSIPELRIESGDVFGLVGGNGAGKTTFLRLILDLLQPDSGSIVIDGMNVHQSVDWKAQTGSFLDESFLIDFLTADEFFRFCAKLYSLPDEDYYKKLLPFQPFYPEELFGETRKLIREMSRGNAKKIGLIAAMFCEPRLVILDEPFATLDPRSQIRLKQLIIDHNRRLGTTFIVSSHDLHHVSEISDRIAILEQGEIVRDMQTSEATLGDLRAYFESDYLSEVRREPEIP